MAMLARYIAVVLGGERKWPQVSKPSNSDYNFESLVLKTHKLNKTFQGGKKKEGKKEKDVSMSHPDLWVLWILEYGIGLLPALI